MRTPIISGDTWFNTPHPITPEDLNGRVVLVDFWTYSCVNCLRTIPYLRTWWERYKDLPFFIIGVHTPEFEFEKDPANVERALKELGVEWPVVLDNDYVNWNNFANHYWPAKYLLDQNGYIVYEHFGEGGYGETEAKIQEYLRKNFGDRSFPPVVAEHGDGGYCFRATPEIYCGHLRGSLANTGGYHVDHIGHYIEPEEIPLHSIALAGDWDARSEHVESIVSDSTIYLHFQATEVNVVLAPVDNLSVVEVKLNGKELLPEVAGKDVDRGDVIVSGPRMYNLVKSDQPIEAILTLRAKESNFRAYAFTFSGCVQQEV